jgi:serine/threonine protein kinase/Tol biopolymer transport system component
VALAPGTRLGPYEVTTQLGEGGMGVVWRARDTQLDRFVALKVLNPAVADDPGRLSRFEREAKILASLNHPHIAHIYGLAGAEAGHGPVLVMELVEGSTLAERIPRGGLPLHDALTIALQIAEALETAHEQGIVHRDLKPANVKVRPDGTVKVLDFGLAKIFAPDASGIDRRADSPTVTALNTQPGQVLGTPAYMSPEQARGEAVDKQADIWAFGCVLYEMLTGRRAFEGSTSIDVMARVLNGKPDLEALPRATPAAVRRLLQRCLSPVRRERLQDIGDARLEISEALATGGSDQQDVGRGTRHRRRWLETIAVAAVAAAIAGTAVWSIRSPGTSPAPVFRSAISLPAAQAFQPALGARNIALSADGMRLAYRAATGIVVRTRDKLDGTLLVPAATGAFFFSPDGQWLAFNQGESLRKVPISGGPSIEIATMAAWPFPTWRGDHLVFADANGLFQVSPEGGTPEALLKQPLGATEQAAYPEVLPDGRTILFTVFPTRGSVNLQGVAGARIEALDRVTGSRKLILRGGAASRYLPTGRLLYVAREGLQAMAFDARSVETRGEAVSLPREVGSIDFDVTQDGLLAYTIGGPAQTDRELVWVDRLGRDESLGAPARPYVYPRVSPDGKRIAVVTSGGTTQPDRDVWMWDVERRLLEQFTVDPTDNATIAWSPTGDRLAFASARTGMWNLFWQRGDGSGTPELLLDSTSAQQPIRFAADGRLLVSADVPGAMRDILALSVDGTRRVESLVGGKTNDLTADVSPDGRWLVYDSDESGRFEVYVRPYPNTADGRWVISTNGGRQPLWSRNGRELYYRDFSGAMLAVPVGGAGGFKPGVAAKLFDGPEFVGRGPIGSAATYDVSPDGRFLMIKAIPPVPASLVVVQNWFQELERLLPVER